MHLILISLYCLIIKRNSRISVNCLCDNTELNLQNIFTSISSKGVTKRFENYIRMNILTSDQSKIQFFLQIYEYNFEILIYEINKLRKLFRRDVKTFEKDWINFLILQLDELSSNKIISNEDLTIEFDQYIFVNKLKAFFIQNVTNDSNSLKKYIYGVLIPCIRIYKEFYFINTMLNKLNMEEKEKMANVIIFYLYYYAENYKPLIKY